ncbi:hypothetical protein GCM10022205_52520 [Spinactinospora alkalitolerans]
MAAILSFTAAWPGKAAVSAPQTAGALSGRVPAASRFAGGLAPGNSPTRPAKTKQGRKISPRPPSSTIQTPGRPRDRFADGRRAGSGRAHITGFTCEAGTIRCRSRRS